LVEHVVWRCIVGLSTEFYIRSSVHRNWMVFLKDVVRFFFGAWFVWIGDGWN